MSELENSWAEIGRLRLLLYRADLAMLQLEGISLASYLSAADAEALRAIVNTIPLPYRQLPED